MDNNGNYNGEVKKASFGWAVLGFFIPLIGIILFAVWNKTEPEKAKNAGIGALVGFLFSFIAPFIFAAILVSGISNGKIEKFINKMNCLDFGTNYEPYEINGEWYCKNKVNDKIMNPYTGREYCQNGDCAELDDDLDEDLDDDEEKNNSKIDNNKNKVPVVDEYYCRENDPEESSNEEEKDEDEGDYLTDVDYKLKYDITISKKAKLYKANEKDSELYLISEGKKYYYSEERNSYITLSDGVAIVHNADKDYKSKINSVVGIYMIEDFDGYSSEFVLLTKDGDLYMGPAFVDFQYESCLNYRALDNIKKIESNNKYKDVKLLLANTNYVGDTPPYEFVGITTDNKMDLLD